MIWFIKLRNIMLNPFKLILQYVDSLFLVYYSQQIIPDPPLKLNPASVVVLHKSQKLLIT